MTPIEALLAGTSECAYVCSLGDGGERHVQSRDMHVIEKFIEVEDRPGRGVYHCVSTIQSGRRRTKENAVECVFLHADIDGHPPLPALPPSIEVNSGRGRHFYWLLDRPVAASSHTDGLLKRLASVVAGDVAVTHRAALMRCVGSHNAKGGAWKKVTAIHHPERVYTLPSIEKWLSQPATGLDAFSEYGRQFTREPINVARKLLDMAPGNFHSTQLSCLASLSEAGDGEDDAVSTVLEATRIAAHGLDWNWHAEEMKLRKMFSSWQAKRGRVA